MKPTDSELEILQVLWLRGTCTVREVHEELCKNREVGYTTTLKMMQIMHEKGLLSRDNSEKTHFYQAIIAEKATQNQLLNRFVDSVFRGSAMKLVMQALGNKDTSQEDLNEIRKFLDDIEKKD